jgi:predicted O-methyltransferase YrrM
MTPPRDLHDYISPGFKAIRLDDYFPNLIAGDPSARTPPHLRRDTPHIWYHDRRIPEIDLLNRDEAHILYNTALRFVGVNALDIGCSMGWSACHMAAAGVTLDVVDPLLGVDWIHRTVTESLTGLGVLRRVRLCAGPSPDTVDALGNAGQRWSLMFIDGDHQFPAPVRDAVACERWATADAAILLRHVNLPAIAEALYFLRDRGWKSRIYKTAQIMAVAWRGQVIPVDHVPDPALEHAIPDHLSAAA